MARGRGHEESNSKHTEKLKSHAKTPVADPLRTSTRAPASPRLQRRNNHRAGDNIDEGGSSSPEPTSSKPSQVNPGRVANTPRPQVRHNALRRPRRTNVFGSPPPSSDLLNEHTAGSSPEGSAVVVALEVPEDTANSALVTTHHGSTLARGRMSLRMIEHYIRRVWDSCCVGIELTQYALDTVKRALLRSRLAQRMTLRELLHYLRGLIPDTLNILRDVLTNETTPVGHAHAPIPGAYASLREVPETAPEATSPSSTNEVSALMLHESPTVQSEPEYSEEHHSASGKDHREVVWAPTKLKTAPEATSPSSTNEASALVLQETSTVQSEPKSSEERHSASDKDHSELISAPTKLKTAGLQSGFKFQKRPHSDLTEPTLFWTGKRTLTSPRSGFQFLNPITRPSGYNNFLGFNGASSRRELPRPSPIIVKFDPGHTRKQLAPLDDFWASKLPPILDRDGRELPVQDLRQLDLESSQKCHALVERFGSTYRATGAMVLRDGDQIHLAVRVEAQHWSGGALMTAFSGGNASIWTKITMMYESGDSPWVWDYTDVLLGPDVEFEPTAVLASDVSMNDAIDESEDDDDALEMTTTEAAMMATTTPSMTTMGSDQEMKDVDIDTYDSGRGHGNSAAGSGSSKQSGHGGASVAAAAAAGTTNQASNNLSCFDAAAPAPIITTTTRREIKQAPSVPAPDLQDSTITTLPPSVSTTPNDGSIGQAPQVHTGPTSKAPNTVTVNTATVTTSNATAAAIQSIGAMQTTLVERLKNPPTNDTEQTFSQSPGITGSAGADNADVNGTTHEVAKSSHNAAKNDTAGSTGDKNVSNEGADGGDDEAGYETEDSVEIITGD